jgi:cobalt-zinc-cadmium efflux system protein
LVALALTFAFVGVEALSGFFANSLALLTDAAHNFTDVVALGLSWYALRLTARRAHSGKTFGYHRAGILIALVNAATLIGLSLVIAFEAVRRLGAPPQVREQIIIVVAGLGFVINLGIALNLRRASRTDINVRSAFAHIAGDALSTLGVVIAGIGIALLGWNWLDPLVGILIAALILWSAWGIVRETVDILLEGTPRGVDMDAVVRDLLSVPGVRAVHDLHVWSISSNLRALSAHILTDDTSISEGARVQRDINDILLNKYDIAHATLQLECIGCEPDLLYCELNPNETLRAIPARER